MTSLATPSVFNRVDFRLHYFDGSPGQDRHWILDCPVGRELLKTVLRKAEAGTVIPFAGDDSHLDVKLNGMLDRVGLRPMPVPSGARERFFIQLKFLVLMVRLELGGVPQV